MQENQGNSKPEQQPERVKLPAPGITSLASTEDIVEVVQSIPSFTENRHDDMIFPSLHMANRELRRAKYKVHKWERICAALRERISTEILSPSFARRMCGEERLNHGVIF